MMKQARLDHEAMKETFDLHDMIVLGIYNEAGIFNVQTVERILAVTEEIKNIEGVLYEDIMAIGEVDDIASEENIIRVYPLAELVENGNEEAARCESHFQEQACFTGWNAVRDLRANRREKHELHDLETDRSNCR